MRIKGFKAIRPPSDRAAQVASAPYDTLSEDEARTIAAANRSSFLRVVRPEVDLAAGTDPHGDDAYEQAVSNLAHFFDSGLLMQEQDACVFAYRQTMGAHSQTGVVACCHVDDYRNDVIRRHELTRPDKEEDRTRHICNLRSHTGPVLLTYADRDEVDQLVEAACKDEPLFQFTADDGIEHTVWRMADTDAVVTVFGAVGTAYIADGHHRAAAAARAAAQDRERRGGSTGEEEYNWFVGALYPAGQMKVLAYNRCVQDLNGVDKDEFLERVGKAVKVTPDGTPEPAVSQQAAMYLDGAWYTLSWDVDSSASPVEALDAHVLQERVLGPVLGIEDPRVSPRIAFVGGIRGTVELERRVDSGEAAVAFSMYPVAVKQIMDVADAGLCMPPKSTWFEPKLRSGLFVHAF